jgi:hypothetical protein
MPTTADKILRSPSVHWVLASLTLLGTPGWAQQEHQVQVSSQQVIQAVQRGLAYLRSQQQPEGNWPEWPGPYHGGTTALGLLAMLTAGVPPDDPAVKAGLAYLDATPNTNTYAVSLKCQVYSLLGGPYRKRLQECTAWLVQRQDASGLWNYGQESYLTGGDYSNTQFAMLGLHMAQVAGVNVPAEVWTRAKGHFAGEQLADGGWNYKPGDNRKDGYGSMTAAAVASLYIAQQHLAEKSAGHVFIDGRYPDCGKFDESQALQRGLAWLARNFSASSHPAGSGKWLYYYLYGVERVGMISGLRFFGAHDWYREGAEFLVGAQQSDGSWLSGDLGQKVVDTVFSVLFLAKGDRPVVVQKLQWDGRWNRNIHDLENLTVFIGDKLGRSVTWQNANLAAPLEQLREAPLLVITGHEFPQFDDQQRLKLRQFVESGGSLLAEACCGSEEFAKGFREFLAQVFPQVRLRELPPEHPVFHSYHDLSDTYGLQGLEGGCRTSIFFSPRALSDLWQLQDIPHYSQLAFELGTNLTAYAFGNRQLGTKLDPGELPEIRKTPIPPDAPPGAVQIATLLHEGDFNPDPHAIANLALLIKQTVGLDVVPRSPIVKADDKDLFQYPVAFMTGHFGFELSPPELEGLRGYLQRGGVLVAEACCGSKLFDAAFRKMAQQLFPDNPLGPLPGDHAIYAGRVGVQPGRLTYRQVLAEELGATGADAAPLEFVSDKGRMMILYSPYDFSCALEGDNPPACRGYVDADGQRLAVVMFLFAIGF